MLIRIKIFDSFVLFKSVMKIFFRYIVIDIFGEGISFYFYIIYVDFKEESIIIMFLKCGFINMILDKIF